MLLNIAILYLILNQVKHLDFHYILECCLHCHFYLYITLVSTENEKALFRRAKANVGAWNPNEAEEDFLKLKSLDPSLTAIIDKELDNINKMRKEKELQDKDAMKKLFAANGK